MKNVSADRLKKCIFADLPIFEQDVKKAIADDVKIFCDYEGISFKQGNSYLDINWVQEKLSKYYGVDVTSIHIDDYDEVGVWVVYVE